VRAHHRKRRVFSAALAVSLFVLLTPRDASAYVGPGAGFAVLSSFLTLFLAFLYSLLALVTWPIRQLVRWRRRRRAYGRARVERVVIIGFDGMDPELATRWIDAGKLPNLARLRDQGTFRKLATTYPPISPVAWSTFLTGVNPGKHNIYDFLARDPGNYLPFLSSAQIRDSKRRLGIGKFSIPIGRPQIRLLRKAKPFWNLLGEAGVFSSVLRVPITFPPEKFQGVLLSGMCVPDLLGSQGTFFSYSSSDNRSQVEEGGVRLRLERNGAGYHSHLPGPDMAGRKKGASALSVPFQLKLQPGVAACVLEIGGQSHMLRKGEYSEWVEVTYHAGMGRNARGICRFLLKEVAPEVELYVTPVNIDPCSPALPISHPLSYSVYLGKLLGPYATLGLAEDTWGLNENVLDDNSFLEQCYQIHDEREKMFFDALDKTSRGVCICVFDITDRVQHMFWRYLEEGHPAAEATAGMPQRRDAIEEMYGRMDALVGRVLNQVDRKTLVLVVSDHGFQSFARGVNLNRWLLDNGYLAHKAGASGGSEWFGDVDWSKTRAFAMGLNGIYINQRGRERAGIVEPGKATQELIRELCAKLTGLADPASGKVGVTEVFDRRTVYTGPYVEGSPDLVICYARGYRAAWESVKGKSAGEIFSDNHKAWSGDHCIDPRLVPGVLFSNHKIEAEEPAIVDVAPTMLELFGVKLPSHFDGKPWSIPSL
jgi:predicted AlkP superfamily phosphohydrolase/phosphomutase